MYCINFFPFPATAFFLCLCRCTSRQSLCMRSASVVSTSSPASKSSGMVSHHGIHEASCGPTSGGISQLGFLHGWWSAGENGVFLVYKYGEIYRNLKILSPLFHNISVTQLQHKFSCFFSLQILTPITITIKKKIDNGYYWTKHTTPE